jgi:hypothetical protein
MYAGQKIPFENSKATKQAQTTRPPWLVARAAMPVRENGPVLPKAHEDRDDASRAPADKHSLLRKVSGLVNAKRSIPTGVSTRSRLTNTLLAERGNAGQGCGSQSIGHLIFCN